MSETTFRPALGQAPGTRAKPAPEAKPAGKHWARKALDVVGSLKVTVVLFALSMGLVFLGTIAYKDLGMWRVLHDYFRSWTIVWIPFQVLVRFGQTFFGVSADATLPGRFPYPGGWLLGGLLLVNLLAAHITRLRVTWKRSGILILHLGVIVLMLGELVTGIFSVENRMQIPLHQSANYLVDYKKPELAIIDPSQPKTDRVVVIPGSLLRDGRLIQNKDLPFDVEVNQFMVNSSNPRPVEPGTETRATAGDGIKLAVAPKPEVSGFGDDSDVPSAFVTFKKKGTGESLGTYLVSAWWSDNWLAGLVERPQVVSLGGKRYEVFLRFQRTYTPYKVELLEFHHDTYIGTETAKNYSSRVRLTDPTRGAEREVTISMNNPLRYDMQTFYQSGVLANDRGTVLQVVDNPAWIIPYIACTLVALGLVIHFGMHLVSFLQRRLAQ
jgi:hypothetical protein